jgi:uncharacterized protein (DUF1330 family)
MGRLALQWYRMPAYLISQFSVAEPEDAKRYAALAGPSVARHGGAYLVQGMVPEKLEGAWPVGQRLSVIEFETVEAIAGWYRSADYAEALAVRTPSMHRSLVFAPGAARS